jgi:hypothetical protein
VRLSLNFLSSVGKELGMSGAHTVALFERIRARYLIGRLHDLVEHINSVHPLAEEAARVLNKYLDDH